MFLVGAPGELGPAHGAADDSGVGLESRNRVVRALDAGAGIGGDGPVDALGTQRQRWGFALPSQLLRWLMQPQLLTGYLRLPVLGRGGAQVPLAGGVVLGRWPVYGPGGGTGAASAVVGASPSTPSRDCGSTSTACVPP